MRKRIFLCLCFILLISFQLVGCSFPSSSSSESDEGIVQTLIAMGLTQTAMVEGQLAEPAVTEMIAAPEEVVLEEEIPLVESEPAAAEIVHNTLPGNPGWINKWFFDTNSASTASGGYVTSGDDFVANLFERPFTATEMIYRSDVDIQKTEISEDATFYYVTIYLDDTHPEGGLQAAYGVEIDEDRDGRGDLLVIADRPASTEWDIGGVSVYRDANNDVGGSKIMRPDTGYAGDAYEQVVFSNEVLTDPDTAWARVSAGAPVSVTIAFKKNLISRDTFVWGVWASDNLLDPTLLDLHDHFTQEEAGSPYPAHSTFPLAAVNLVDNTCRETYKFEATESIPGLCYVPQKPTDTPPEETEPPLGEIYGVAFDDINNNGVRNAGEPLTVYSVTITLRQGSCSGTIIASTNAKSFSFSGLEPGSYCVSISPPGSMTTPSSQTVTVPAGGSIYIEFGYYVIG